MKPVSKQLLLTWLLTLVFSVTGIAIAQESSDRLSPAEAMQRFTVAEGLQVKTFAADPDIVSISNIDVDARGRVWACECVNYRGNNGKRPEGDRILILEDSDGDGVSDSQKVFYQGRDIDIAMGLCVLGNKAIVSCTPNIVLLEDTDGDDKADKKTVLFTSDGVFQHDHSLHSIVFGSDGRYYGNFGNTGRNLKRADGSPITDRAGNVIDDSGKPYHGGMIFCDSGPHVVWSMGVKESGAGFRSDRIEILRSTDNNFRPVDVAVAPDGSLFVSDW